MKQVWSTGIIQIFQAHGSKPDVSLPSCERIFEFSGSPKGGGTGRQYPHFWIMIGRDLEQFRGVGQPMDLVQNHSTPPQAFKKILGIFHDAPDARQFAVEIFNVGQALAEGGLANAPHPREPYDGSLAPSLFDLCLPKTAPYHTSIYWHLVRLNASLSAFSTRPYPATLGLVASFFISLRSQRWRQARMAGCTSLN